MWNSMRNYFRLSAEGREHGLLARLLGPLLELAGVLYGAAVGVARTLYEKKILHREKLPFPVVSIGNLTWGGTGKTPLVEYITSKISHRQKNPIVLSRGYSHDEVEMFRQHFPRAVIGVGKDRSAVARKMAQTNHIDIAILDDGFQHWKIERDLEIVTVNAINPFGNGKLIPRGILREPVSALKRAQVVLIAYADLVKADELEKLRNRLREIAPSSLIAEAYLDPIFFYRARTHSRVSLERLQNQRVTTFSGIAAPRSFQLLLMHHHIKPFRNFEFPDHYRFTLSELDEVKKVSQAAGAEEIITTEKDFYRCPEDIVNRLNPLVLATKLRIAAGEDALLDRLYKLVGGAGLVPPRPD